MTHEPLEVERPDFLFSNVDRFRKRKVPVTPAVPKVAPLLVARPEVVVVPPLSHGSGSVKRADG